MSQRMLAACVLIWVGSVMAGAWDTGPFDNDDALDWVWELSESNDLSVIESTLRNAADESAYLEAPTASMAIAAAEVVAALRGNPRSELPVDVAEWVQAHPIAVDDDLLQVARKALERINNLESSELAQLWAESGEPMDIWLADLDALLQRLK